VTTATSGPSSFTTVPPVQSRLIRDLEATAMPFHQTLASSMNWRFPCDRRDQEQSPALCEGWQRRSVNDPILELSREPPKSRFRWRIDSVVESVDAPLEGATERRGCGHHHQVPCYGPG
jgi:hypothetical protein